MFKMFKVNEGGKWHIGTAATFEAARAHILAFAELWPAEYGIVNEETQEWISVPVYSEKDRLDSPTSSSAQPCAPLREQNLSH